MTIPFNIGYPHWLSQAKPLVAPRPSFLGVPRSGEYSQSPGAGLGSVLAALSTFGVPKGGRKASRHRSIAFPIAFYANYEEALPTRGPTCMLKLKRGV